MWENGHLVPSEKMVRQLSKILDVEISVLSDLESDIPAAYNLLSDFTDSWFSLSDFEEKIHKDKVGGLLSGIISLDKQVKQASTVISAIISSMHSLFYVKDTNQKYIIANKAFLKTLFNDENYRILGKTDKDLFPLKDVETNTEQDSTVISSGKALFDIEDYILGTRKKKWGIISKKPILDRTGKITGVAGIIVDITERKRNEQQRIALHEAVNHLEECVWVAKIQDFTENKYKVVYINDAIEKMSGVKKKEFIKKSELWFDFIHPDFKEKVRKARESKEFPRYYEYKAIRKNTGEEYWRSDATYKIGNMFFGIARDISKPKKEIESLLKKNNINIAKTLIKNGVSKEIVLKSMDIDVMDLEEKV